MSFKNNAEIATRNDRKAALKRYETEIAKGALSFLKVGESLGRVRKEGLYEELKYPTFEAYVEDRWDMSARHAERMISAARVVLMLGPIGRMIKNESTARELVVFDLDTEKMQHVLDATMARTGRITAAAVREVREELYPETKVIDGDVVQDPPQLGSTERLAIEAPAEAVPSVHVHCQFTRESMPECVVVGSDNFKVTAEQVTCLACKEWMASRDGWNWRFGASKAYPGDPACEACGKELDGSIVKAAQVRCLTCDPDRIHYAVAVGGTCEVCAAADLETAALVGEPTDTPAGENPPPGALVADQPGPEDSSPGSETDEAPAGTEYSVNTAGPAVATSRPGIDHPDPHLGEARAEADLPGAGVVPPSDVAGVHEGGDEVEGGDDPVSDLPSTDPASEFMDRWRQLVRHALGVDRDVVGPMLTEDEFSEMYGDIEALTYLVKKLHGTP